jgi:hypothetical protein
MIAALGFVVLALIFLVLFGYGVLTPDHPYRVGYGPHQRALSRRLSFACWFGGLGFVASLIMAGRFLP